jgi:thiamine biosynthesis lipoprotein
MTGLASALVLGLVGFAQPGTALDPSHTASSATVSVERARWLMGTLCTVVVEHRDREAALRTLTAALDEIDRLENVMSSWREDSELARLNRSAAAGPVVCSTDLVAVLDSALALARLSGGAFDPTVAPLVDAWDLRGTGHVPDARTITVALARVGWRGLEVDRRAGTARFARPGMAIDLGGIGKGFALDRAAATLTGLGASRALVNLGGEVMAVGRSHTVTVAHPAARLAPVVELEVGDACVSTSGQSERGFTAGGVRHGHVLDPGTGRPAATAASVTVVCRSATRADALATALLVMGRERAADFARGRPEVGVLWLEPAGAAARAWNWNLPTARAAPGAEVQWMDRAEWAAHTLEKGTR